MPTPVNRAPGAWTPFGSDEEHLAAHRAIDAALISMGSGTPSTSSTIAPIVGIYRTAASVNVGIPSMSTTSVISTVVSVETQVGNPVQPGVPIIASPQAALPAAVNFNGAYCVNTNSIIFQFQAISGINATTTVAFHVLSVDTIP